MKLKEVKKAYLQSRDKILKYENVIGVGYGPIEKEGKLTQQIGLIAYVSQKVSVNKLKKSQIIPKSIQKIGIDVREPRLTEEEQLIFLKKNGIELDEIDCLIDHFFINESKIHALNRTRIAKLIKQGKLEPKDPSTAIKGDIFVIEDDGTLVSGSNIDHVEAYNIFRSEFGDHYDFVFFHYDTASGIPSQGNSSPTIHNTITGINHYKGDSYDDRSTWNSVKIQSYQKITNLTQIRRMLHETAHRWCAYVYHKEGGATSDNLHEEFSSASQKPFHWGSWFDNDHSCMDYDYYDWIDSSITSGEFEKKNLIRGLPGDDEFNYHPLDLYLMGLISTSEVGNFRYINNPQDANNDGSYTGTEVVLNISNVTDENGVRSPAYPNTQRVFHQAYILITNDLTGIGTLSDTSTVLGNMERYKDGFIEAFRKSTNSRAMIDPSLLYSNYSSIFVRDNNSDTGTTTTTGPFWNSPDIWIRNFDDGGSIHQDTDSQRDNFIHVRISNSSSSSYNKVKVKVYVANYAGTEFYYPDNWHPNNFIGQDVIDVPAMGNTIAKVKWEMNDIPDETWHPCILVELLPMQTIPNGRHHVWDNEKLAQKNITIIYPPGDNENSLLKKYSFVFGNSLNNITSKKVLSIVSNINSTDLKIILKSNDKQIFKPYENLYLNEKLNQFLKDKIEMSCKEYSTNMLLNFPEDTTILLGKSKNIEVNIKKGSSLEIVDRQEKNLLKWSNEENSSQLKAVNHGISSYIFNTDFKVEKLDLILDYSEVKERKNIFGTITIVQITEKGEIEGGLDIELRPN